MDYVSGHLSDEPVRHAHQPRYNLHDSLLAYNVQRPSPALVYTDRKMQGTSLTSSLSHSVPTEITYDVDLSQKPILTIHASKEKKKRKGNLSTYQIQIITENK